MQHRNLPVSGVAAALVLLAVAGVSAHGMTLKTEAIAGDTVRAPGAWSAPNAALQHWVLPEFDMRVGMAHSRMAEHRTDAALAA